MNKRGSTELMLICFIASMWKRVLSVGWFLCFILSMISSSQSSGKKMVPIIYNETFKKSEFRVFMTSLHPASQISLILLPYQFVPSRSLSECVTNVLSSLSTTLTICVFHSREAYLVTISYFTRTTHSQFIMDIKGYNAKNQKHINSG